MPGKFIASKREDTRAKARGRFIVIYGANNLGKSTQVELLVDRLKKEGKRVSQLKYPIYDIPSGKKINKELRTERTLDDLELQKLFAQNRKDFEPDLKNMLASGINVVAEDYKGTGIAWGVTNGIPLETMEEINKDLLDTDIAILIDGERFTEAIEKDHRYEDSDKWERAREVHLMLGERYNWQKVNANQPIEKVAEYIWAIVSKSLQ